MRDGYGCWKKKFEKKKIAQEIRINNMKENAQKPLCRLLVVIISKLSLRDIAG